MTDRARLSEKQVVTAVREYRRTGLNCIPVFCVHCVCSPCVHVKVCTWAYTVISRLSAHGRLKFTGQKTGVGIYTEKPFVRITHIHTDHRIIKKRRWALTRENTVRK